jgi:TRAP-type C4-dicarboxylate transport system permease small subunit
MRYFSVGTLIRVVFRYCYDFAGCSLVFLMTITAIDIFGRNTGLYSIRGVIEISTMAVVLIGFLALPHSLIVGGHIVVDLATLRVPARINKHIDAFWLIVAAVCLGFVAWLMWGAALKALRDNVLSLDLQAPMAIFWVPAAIGMSLAPFACLLTAFEKLREE